MKVLILPNNIASMPSITADRLNRKGINVKALFLDTNPNQQQFSGKGFPLKGLRFGFLHKVFNFSRFYIHAIRGIFWADVIHYCGSFSMPLNNLLFPFIRLFNKPALVEWVGSDIRIPEVEFLENKYYKEAFYSGYEYPYESVIQSRKIQQMFKNAGFVPLVFPGMEQYILSDIFPTYYKFIQRIDLNNYVPNPPELNKSKPLIVHAPTAPIAKGTNYIEAALEELSNTYDFDYVRAFKLSRQEVLDLIGKCDVFIDQIVLGSYGMASMEAFAFAKPVVCYMKPSVLSCFPGTSPIINANPDTIKSVIEDLLKSGVRRHEAGMVSRKYAETYHDIDSCIDELIDIYSDSIKIKKNPK
ncbi:MAG: hypothetical protein IPO63_06235 [Bacteroidetes bacterium]|nr:hypothetical protein [Bacteroidota bacterium]